MNFDNRNAADWPQDVERLAHQMPELIPELRGAPRANMTAMEFEDGEGLGVFAINFNQFVLQVLVDIYSEEPDFMEAEILESRRIERENLNPPEILAENMKYLHEYHGNEIGEIRPENILGPIDPEWHGQVKEFSHYPDENIPLIEELDNECFRTDTGFKDGEKFFITLNPKKGFQALYRLIESSNRGFEAEIIETRNIEEEVENAADCYRKNLEFLRENTAYGGDR